MTPTHIGILTYDLMKVNFLVHLSDFSEPFFYAIYFTFFCFGGLNTDMRTSRTEIRAGGAWYCTFSFVFIHVCVQKMLSSINMKKCCKSVGVKDGFSQIHPCWYNTLLLFFIHLLHFPQSLVVQQQFFLFRLNKEKRNTKMLNWRVFLTT